VDPLCQPVCSFWAILPWTGFSLFITLLQNMLHHAALLSPMMESTSPMLGGIIFTAAGIYQWTPLKQTCLKRCRSPLGFILFRWRNALRGALFMGLEYSVYCMGCCGLLMGLLFVEAV
jgi:predicted metal-binding membrane protein